MKQLILVVDDNPDILKNMKFTLEKKEYEVVTAESANTALALLEEDNLIPDLIISDILMPKMDGYDFYDEISSKPKWSMIPFIFLTAKSSSEDIRFGKSLGVDDYITKPFSNKDLLSSVKGKLLRKEMATSVQEKFTELMKNHRILGNGTGSEVKLKKATDITVLTAFWDDEIGPMLEKHYPPKKKESFDLDEMATKLFNGIVLIYGQKNIKSAEGLLIKLETINKWGYIYFDAYQDHDSRSGQQRYMIGVIAPYISYLQSLKIKKLFSELSVSIKKSPKVYELKKYWKRIKSVLLENSLSID